MYICATNASTSMGMRARKAVALVQQQAGSEIWRMNLKYLRPWLWITFSTKQHFLNYLQGYLSI